MKVKALRINVYRGNLGDCTLGGISSKFNDLYILCDEGPDMIDEDDPKLLRVVNRTIFGELRPYLEPVNGKDPEKVGWMMGGNFGYASDSRFPFGFALPIHDRQETQEDYDLLSR